MERSRLEWYIIIGNSYDVDQCDKGKPKTCQENETLRKVTEIEGASEGIFDGE